MPVAVLEGASYLCLPDFEKIPTTKKKVVYKIFFSLFFNYSRINLIVLVWKLFVLKWNGMKVVCFHIAEKDMLRNINTRWLFHSHVYHSMDTFCISIMLFIPSVRKIFSGWLTFFIGLEIWGVYLTPGFYSHLDKLYFKCLGAAHSREIDNTGLCAVCCAESLSRVWLFSQPHGL